MTNHDVIVGNNSPATDCSQDSDCASDDADVDSDHIRCDDVTIQDGGAVVPSVAAAGGHRPLPPVGDLPMYVTYTPQRADNTVQINRGFVTDLEEQWGKPPAYDEIFQTTPTSHVTQSTGFTTANHAQMSSSTNAVVSLSATNDDAVQGNEEDYVTTRGTCSKCVVVTVLILLALAILYYIGEH